MISLSNGVYEFGWNQKALSQEAFDLLDKNKDGQISQDEVTLFDTSTRVKYGQDTKEKTTGEKLVEAFKGNIFLGSDDWITDDVEKEAYAFYMNSGMNRTQKLTDGFNDGLDAIGARTHDGLLTAEDNQWLKEMEELNNIANEFIQNNSQYIVGDFGGVVRDVQDVLNSFLEKNKKTKDIDKLSDSFKTYLDSTLTEDKLVKSAINTLTNDHWAFESDISWKEEVANSDGKITDKENKEIIEATVDVLMQKALHGEDINEILSGILDGVTDANTKKQLVSAAEELKKIANQRFLKKPAEMFNEMRTIATNMAEMVSGKEIADGVEDNRYNEAEQHLNDNRLVDIREGVTAGFSGKLVRAALESKDEESINSLAEQIADWFKSSCGEWCNYDKAVIAQVLSVMPTDISSFHSGGGSIDMHKFVEVFNETLDSLKDNTINIQAIDFGFDENVRLKSEETLALENKWGVNNEENKEAFYTQRVTKETAKATIDGIKTQVKGLAETNYIVHGVDFNKELFDDIFDDCSTEVLSQLESGQTMNNILSTMLSEFNSKWAPMATKDIVEKEAALEEKNKEKNG